MPKREGGGPIAPQRNGGRRAGPKGRYGGALKGSPGTSGPAVKKAWNERQRVKHL